MIRYVILIALFCSLSWGYNVEVLEAQQPSDFNLEEIEDPLSLDLYNKGLEDLQPPPEFQIDVKEFPLPSHLRRCLPTMCCKINLKCGQPYSCLDPITNKFVTNMEPCL